MEMSSYGFNKTDENLVDSHTCWQNNSKFISVKKLTKHSTKVILAEADSALATGWWAGGLVDKSTFWTGHNGKGAGLFSDGHVDSSRRDPTPANIKSLYWRWSWRFDGY